MTARKKAIVIGLDGATWELLRILMRKGLLPSLQRIVQDGIQSTLLSTFPPDSAPAWTSFSTGRNPGKHGIYEAFRQGSGSRTEPVSSRDIACETLFETMSKDNSRTVMINLPLSYPPKDIDGVIIGDWMAPKGYTYPDSASCYIDNYRHMYDQEKTGKKGILDILDLEERRFELAKTILIKEDWDLFLVIFSGIDWLSHRMYEDVKSGSSIGKLARCVFTLADSVLGWFKDSMDQDTILILLSEHGFHSFEGIFRINSWLEKQGWLVRKRSTNESGDPLLASASNSNVISEQGIRFEIPDWIISVVTRFPKLLKWTRRFQSFTGRRLEFPSEWEIDIEKSEALFPSIYGCGLYINSTVVTEEDRYEKLVDDIVRRMRDLRDNENKRVFESVGRGSNFYHGRSASLAPDIVFKQSDKWMVERSLSPSSETEEHFLTMPVQGHHNEGVFVAYGNRISKSERIPSVSICDIAPSLLHFFDIEIPNDMDGRPLVEIFSTDQTRDVDVH